MPVPPGGRTRSVYQGCRQQEIDSVSKPERVAKYVHVLIEIYAKTSCMKAAVHGGAACPGGGLLGLHLPWWQHRLRAARGHLKCGY